MWLKRLLKLGVNALGYDLVRSGLYECLETHLPALLADLKINCVLDVGAHVGEYGRLLRELGYAGKIVSFEPVTTSFAELESRSSRDRAWTVQHIALGDRNESRPIHVTAQSKLASFLLPNLYCRTEFGDKSTVTRIENVEVRRLDTILPEIIRDTTPPRIFLKVDTQGHDLSVVSGLGEYVKFVFGLQSEVAVQPIYENMTPYRDALEQLEHHGFQITGMFPVNRTRDRRVIEFDCVMRRA